MCYLFLESDLICYQYTNLCADNNISLTFSPLECFFQDLSKKEHSPLGRLKYRLYCTQDTKQCGVFNKVAKGQVTITPNSSLLNHTSDSVAHSIFISRFHVLKNLKFALFVLWHVNIGCPFPIVRLRNTQPLNCYRLIHGGLIPILHVMDVKCFLLLLTILP